MRKCGGSGDAEVTEKAAETTMNTAAGGRKRKFVSGDRSELSTSLVECKTRRLAVAAPDASYSPASSRNTSSESVNSGFVLSSCCSNSRLNERLAKESSKFVDLAREDELTLEFFATSAGNSVDFSDRKEKAPSSEVHAAPGESASTARLCESNFHRCSTADDKIPSHAEIEEFFTTAEANLRRQFIDKYNYDIVKDAPTEGRFEWVPIQLKP